MIRSIRGLSLSITPLLLAGCAAALPAGVASASGGGAGGVTDAAEAAREVGELVNRHRARAGCPPLVWDEAATRAALAHSTDMARRNYFSHTTPDGRTMADRLRAQGIVYRRAAENIAMGQQTARQAVSSWLGSEGHRENIENCALTRQGVGMVAGRWTHVFYTPF
jgi:uncharacterized protein YkwD